MVWPLGRDADKQPFEGAVYVVQGQVKDALGPTRPEGGYGKGGRGQTALAGFKPESKAACFDLIKYPCDPAGILLMIDSILLLVQHKFPGPCSTQITRINCDRIAQMVGDRMCQ